MNEGLSSMTTENPGFSVFNSIAEIPAGFGPSVAAIGNFDGVHLGHREILAAVVEEARASGARAVAITFDPHPEKYLRPEHAPPLLTPMPERLRLLGGTGIDAVVVLPFDAALKNLSARDFAHLILAGALGVRALHEGHSFRFGRGAEAGVKELKVLGAELGFAVRVHDARRERAQRAWRGAGVCRARTRRGAGARIGSFQFGNPGAGGCGRHAQGAMDAG